MSRFVVLFIVVIELLEAIADGDRHGTNNKKVNRANYSSSYSDDDDDDTTRGDFDDGTFDIFRRNNDIDLNIIDNINKDTNDKRHSINLRPIYKSNNIIQPNKGEGNPYNVEYIKNILKSMRKGHLNLDTYENKNYLNYSNENYRGLQDYSKIYVILNTDAVTRSPNKNLLKQLISRIVDLSSPPNKMNQNHLYRKFSGKEMFTSSEDDYRPKRKPFGRNKGHTAIPIIGNKRDVYDRL